MKKKGFTLIELLAVIAILAILAILVIMALPAVLRMYRQSRINSFQNEVRGVYKTAQQQFVSDSMSLNAGGMIAYTNAGSSVTGVDTVKELEMTVNSNFKYYVLMNVDGKVLNIRATNGTYSYTLKASDEDHDIKIENIDVEANNESILDSNIESSLCASSEGTYVPIHIATVVEGQTCSKTTPECKLRIAGEDFYVVSSNSTSTVLLAEYDLTSDGSTYKQDTTGTKTNTEKVSLLNDDNVAYWDSAQCTHDSDWSCTTGHSGLKSPYSDGGKVYCDSISSTPTNCAYVYDSNAVNVYPVVNSYANKIKTAVGVQVIGRLLSLEEAYNLSVDIRSDKNASYYWLGSVSGDRGGWRVKYDGGINYNGSYNTYSIRPVIIVSTSVL